MDQRTNLWDPRLVRDARHHGLVVVALTCPFGFTAVACSENCQRHWIATKAVKLFDVEHPKSSYLVYFGFMSTSFKIDQ